MNTFLKLSMPCASIATGGPNKTLRDGPQINHPAVTNQEPLSDVTQQAEVQM